MVFVNDGRQQTLTADSVLCTIPFSVLRNIELPALSARKKDMIKRHSLRCGFARLPANKESLLGRKGTNGFAFTSGAIEIWQPTWSQPGPRGILMTYARPGEAERITKLKEKDRIAYDAETVGRDLCGASRKLRTRRYEVLDGRRMVARSVGVCWFERLLHSVSARGQNSFRRRTSVAVVFVDSGGVVVRVEGGEGD